MKLGNVGIGILAALFLSVPAMAQHPGHGPHGGHNAPGRGHEGHEGHGGRGGSERRHYDERNHRFDAEYRNRYFGREHVFLPELIIINGQTEFFYGEFYYAFEEPIEFPPEGCYIDAEGDEYFMYSTHFPGWHRRVIVIL